MLGLEEAKALLNKYSFNPGGPGAEGWSVNKDQVESLETVIRLYQALQDEVLGFRGPFLPMDPTDTEGMKAYKKAIKAWADRRREHEAWVGRGL